MYSSIDPLTESFVLPFCCKQQQVNFWGTPENLGLNGSNNLCGRSKASKLSLQLADRIFYKREMEARENGDFLIFGLQLENEEEYCDGP